MDNKFVYYDGKNIKSYNNPWDVDDNVGWQILSGQDQSRGDAEYYKFIPTLFRAVQLRANAVSTMPFELMRGKTVYDSSAEWKNKVGFLPNPMTMLQLVESALILSGSAYLFRERSIAATKALKYHLPSSITPEFNQKTGELLYFKRPVNGVVKYFTPDNYVYFWQPDPFVEVGPAINYPAKAAANACGVLLNIDLFSEAFFERGAIKAMLLTVKGMPAESERSRLEVWWKRVVGGVRNAFGAKIINADAITPVVIGEGIKELENATVTQEKRQDISLALGIPESILFANAANFATSQQDDLNFLTKTIIPDCEFIASVLNEQLFDALGLHLQFLPETLDAMQEDEAQRATAFRDLTASGDIPVLAAMNILGYELDDETRLMIEQAVEEKRRQSEEAARRMEQQANQSEAQPAQEQEDEQPTPTRSLPVLSPAAFSDLDMWRRLAIKAAGKGEPVNFVFTRTDNIPPVMYSNVANALESAQTKEEVIEVFAGIGGYPSQNTTQTDEIKAIVEAIRLAVEALKVKDGNI